VITCSTERDADRERSYLRLLRSMRAAGVIFAGSGRDDPALNEDLQRHVDGIREVGAAVVHLSPHAAGKPEVRTDNEGGIAALVRALVALGHHRIAFLAGPSALFVARDRLAGYRRGMAEAGLEVDDRLIVRTSFDREGGSLAVDTLLSGGAPFTALLCANDLLALGALGRLAELGIRVPDDVSVAGFDDIGVAALTAPSLTTVRVHLRELGRRGFVAVARVLAGEDAGTEDLPIDVVLRASTASPPPHPLPLPFTAPGGTS
jgi:LacI family transcriptional regulator